MIYQLKRPTHVRRKFLIPFGKYVRRDGRNPFGKLQFSICSGSDILGRLQWIRIINSAYALAFGSRLKRSLTEFLALADMHAINERSLCNREITAEAH
jgi:hypothetical protein